MRKEGVSSPFQFPNLIDTAINQLIIPSHTNPNNLTESEFQTSCFPVFPFHHYESYELNPATTVEIAGKKYLVFETNPSNPDSEFHGRNDFLLSSSPFIPDIEERTGCRFEKQAIATMKEDTEEIDALLYTDDEENEGISTGHSPLDRKEEISISYGSSNKRKISKIEIDTSLADTASSTDVHLLNRYAQTENQPDNISVNKRLKREKVRKTVAVLKKFIPGGKGTDASMILDEAIEYLKSLKLKAKAMGATSFK